MICSVILVLKLALLDGRAAFDTIPAPNANIAATLIRELSGPNYRQELLRRGVVGVTQHDLVNVKPFDCEPKKKMH